MYNRIQLYNIKEKITFLSFSFLVMDSKIASRKTSFVMRSCFFRRWLTIVLLQLLFNGQRGHPYHFRRSWNTFICSTTDSVATFEYWQYGHWGSPFSVSVISCNLSMAKEGCGQFMATLSLFSELFSSDSLISLRVEWESFSLSSSCTSLMKWKCYNSSFWQRLLRLSLLFTNVSFEY